MDFLISLFSGLAACGVVFFALFKALKQWGMIETFIESKLKMPWLAAQFWWLFPLFFLITVVNLVQRIVAFIDPSISF